MLYEANDIWLQWNPSMHFVNTTDYSTMLNFGMLPLVEIDHVTR